MDAARTSRARVGALLAAVPLAVAACGGGEPSAEPPASPTAATTPAPATTEAPRTLAWRAIDAAGPSARRDHTLTADDGAGVAYLFGGRAGGKALGDLWAFDVRARAWEEIEAKGPRSRFGHNAAFINGRLVVFGGQGGPGAFFSDVWSFDPGARKWANVTPRGDAPAARYGAGAATIQARLVVTHGFTDAGRFDDTWSFGRTWKDVSPSAGPRPVERCLHRAAYLASDRKLVLFGGQTTGTPFLGDTWTYEPILRSWRQVPGRGPSARNLYAAGTTADAVYVFGGFGAGGALADLWAFDGKAWERLSPAGPRPPARGGVEGVILDGRMYVFGGSDGGDELSDLWVLTLP